MMDIVFQRDPATDDKVYVRQTLMDTVKTPLDTAFGALNDAVANSSTSISDQAVVQDLRTLIRDNPMDAFIIPDPDKVSNDPTLSPMLTESALAVSLTTTSKCADFTSSDGTLPGVNNFVSVMSSYGNETDVPGTCAETFTCSVGATLAACSAGNAFLGLKRTLLDSSNDIFRCDIFEDAAGNDCDPINMVQDGSGNWQNDCLITEGSTKVTRPKVKTCSLAEFVTYVEGFDTRIEKVLSRLDSETQSVLSGIETDMKDVIDEHILQPILGIADGITCGFMPKFYQDVVYNMCYQGVVGLRGIGKSYVLLSFVMLVLSLVMYVEFRRAIDNIDCQRDTELAGEECTSQDSPTVGE